MILVAFPHGLRASELCDLLWDQVEFGAGVLAPTASSSHASQPAPRSCRPALGLRVILGLWGLLAARETNGAAVGRACYLIGYAKCFKVSQELIFSTVAPRVKIYIR
jgi:hypothetical protein